jgi:ribonuclease HI
VEGGRVEIRYKPNDKKAYFAAASNLERDVASPGLLPDDHCGEATGVNDGTKSAAKSASGATAQEKVRGKTAVLPAAARPGEWIAYADGACSGNPGPAGLGIVLISPDGKIHEGREYLGIGTNNIAELTGVLRVLEATPQEAEGILIHTDSKYAIGVLSQGWKAKANPELVATIRAALKRRSHVRLSYVPGHAGVPLNERADELAREAVKTGKSSALVLDKS